MNNYKVILFTFILLLFNPIFAQFSSSSAKSKEQHKSQKSTSKKTITETTKNCTNYEGLFTIYQDKDNAKSFLEIDTAQLNATGFPSENKGVYIYAVNYNVLRIMSGMGGLAYSN